MSLTPEIALYIAQHNGLKPDGTKATQAEMSEANSLFSVQPQTNAPVWNSIFPPKPVGINVSQGATIERTTSCETKTDSDKVEVTHTSTTSVVTTSDEFKAEDAAKTIEIKKLASEHKNDNAKTEAKLNEESFYDGARKIVANVENTPEVTETIVENAKKYDNNQDAFVNDEACFLATSKKEFLKSGYLENSANAEMAEIAKKANYTKNSNLTPDEVEARHIIDAKLAQWNRFAVDNAQKGEEVIAAAEKSGVSHESAVKKAIAAGYLDDHGYPIIPEGSPIVVPAEYATKIDQEKIKASNPPQPVPKDEPISPPPNEPIPVVQQPSKSGGPTYSYHWTIGAKSKDSSGKDRDGHIGIPTPTADKAGRVSLNSIVPWAVTGTNYVPNGFIVSLSEKFAQEDTDGDSYVSYQEAVDAAKKMYPKADYEYINPDAYKGKGINKETIKQIEINGWNAVKYDENGKKIFYRDEKFNSSIPLEELLEDIPS